MKFVQHLAIVSVVFASSVSASFAADNEAQPVVQPREWAVIVSPYIWAASLTGKGSLAGFNTNVNVPFSDTFEHLDFALMGNIEVTNGQWGVFFDGQYVRTSQDEEAFSQEIGLDIKSVSLTAGAFLKAYEIVLDGDTVFNRPRTFSVEPMAGLRWTKMEATVSVAAFGVHVDKSAHWVDPFIGFRLNADLTERWNLYSSFDISGFDVGSKIAVNAQAALGYRVMLFDRPTILRAGYRVLYQDYENDDFTGVNKFRWDVTQHGPIVGLSMRF